MVLIAAMRSAPPIAFTARSTRGCSLVGVAQETSNKAPESAARICFIEPPSQDGCNQPRRTESWLQLFLLLRRGSGGGGGGASRGAGRGLGSGLGELRIEFVAADAPVAVAVDGDPVRALRLGRGQLLRAQVAVLVLVQPVEQGNVVICA